jgi:ADP-heptose:LPS heptosyltransferase
MSPGFTSKPAGSRLAGRMRVLPRAVSHRFMHLRPRERPAAPRRILIAHSLLLGDTLMLTPLIAKLRERHPQARIVMTVRRELMPLYTGRPYGVEPLLLDVRDVRTLDALFSFDGFDLAYVPGDNRHAWLAAAAGARWIVAHAGDRPAWKSWPVDELRPYSEAPASWADMTAMLAEGPAPRPYRPEDWPSPANAPVAMPKVPYCVLHVGAGSPLRLWNRDRWLALAEILAANGLQPVWSGGPGEEAEIEAVDPQRRFPSYAGAIDLPQLWHLIEGARVLVCPDTGIAHLGRLAGAPVVTLYGPGSPVLFGPGDFWRDAPGRQVAVDPFACRDQRTLFKREIAWVRRCQRTLAQCPAPRCMHAIGTEDVARAALDCARHAR